MWRRDKKGYLKLARDKGSFVAFLATQFEREDADRGLSQTSKSRTPSFPS
jgi:hypothetical protein